MGRPKGFTEPSRRGSVSQICRNSITSGLVYLYNRVQQYGRGAYLQAETNFPTTPS